MSVSDSLSIVEAVNIDPQSAVSCTCELEIGEVSDKADEIIALLNTIIGSL